MIWGDEASIVSLRQMIWVCWQWRLCHCPARPQFSPSPSSIIQVKLFTESGNKCRFCWPCKVMPVFLNTLEISKFGSIMLLLNQPPLFSSKAKFLREKDRFFKTLVFCCCLLWTFIPHLLYRKVKERNTLFGSPVLQRQDYTCRIYKFNN